MQYMYFSHYGEISQPTWATEGEFVSPII
jgi:hypothetical protein